MGMETSTIFPYAISKNETLPSRLHPSIGFINLVPIEAAYCTQAVLSEKEVPAYAYNLKRHQALCPLLFCYAAPVKFIEQFPVQLRTP